MADVKLTNAAFVYGGVRYYRGKAEGVTLASFGEKKTPLLQVNYLSLYKNVNRDKLANVKVKTVGPIAIEWERYSDADVNLDIKYLTAAGGTGSFNRKAAKSAELKLLKLSIPEGQLKDLLNKHADGARNYLANEGADSRIVSEVWVVVEGKLGSQISTDVSIAGEGAGNGLKLEVGASTSSTTKTAITLPQDSTFAYLLHKVKKWDNGRQRVDELEDDQHGPV